MGRNEKAPTNEGKGSFEHLPPVSHSLQTSASLGGKEKAPTALGGKGFGYIDQVLTPLVARIIENKPQIGETIDYYQYSMSNTTYHQ